MKKAFYLLVATALLLLLAYFATPPAKLYRAAIALEQSLAGLDAKSVQVNGQRWEYVEGGQGEPLLLLHGFAADKGNWTRLARSLGGRYRVIAPDLLGFGDSAKPTDLDYDVASQAERVFAFADAIGLEQFDVGGNSMGGYIAGVMSAQQPQRIRSLWLLAPAGVVSAPNSELFELILQTGTNPLIVQQRSDFTLTWDFVFHQPPFLPGRVRDGFADLQMERIELYEQIFSDLRFDNAALEEQLRDASVPTLIVWGEKDRVLHPDGGPVLAGLLQNATLITLPEVGHVPMVEVPKSTSESYLEWRRAGGR